MVLGLSGSQGSGKSTLAQALLDGCAAEGTAAAALSLDDLYLTRAERERLGKEVHPLLATRGPPGTHDVRLGLEVMAALRRGEAVALPRFDKAQDDRAPEGTWPISPPDCEVLIFEGWCVGALPQDEAELSEPVNALEAGEDPQGIWRQTCNAALAGPYRGLFGSIDRLVLLAAPDFEVVHTWRWEQERALIETRGAGGAAMNEAGVARFIRFYERLTRHVLAEMPGRADLTIRLDGDRRPVSILRSGV